MGGSGYGVQAELSLNPFVRRAQSVVAAFKSRFFFGAFSVKVAGQMG